MLFVMRFGGEGEAAVEGFRGPVGLGKGVM